MYPHMATILVKSEMRNTHALAPLEAAIVLGVASMTNTRLTAGGDNALQSHGIGIVEGWTAIRAKDVYES